VFAGPIILYVRVNTYLLASGRFILEQKKYQTHAQTAAALRSEFLFFFVRAPDCPFKKVFFSYLVANPLKFDNLVLAVEILLGLPRVVFLVIVSLKGQSSVKILYIFNLNI
jgi:hypothetical protein